jgi:serine/threonine protein kinase
MFRVGQIIKDPYSHDSYRIEQALGNGGFGQTYRAERLTQTGRRRPRGLGTVCLKVTTDPVPWHGEAYFGLLTQGLPNVVQHLGSFPLQARGGMRYLLIMELKTGGTVQDWIDQGSDPWTVGQVLNALCPLARTLDALHASGAMHRDIKPANVFIGNRKSLCLGDFGIAFHGLRGRGPRANAFTEAFVATSLLQTRHEWLPSDDVYQLGLRLLLGREVSNPDWRSLRHRIDHDGLRQVLQRATGPRVGRYASAGQFYRDIVLLRTKAHGPIDLRSAISPVTLRKIQ